MEYILYGTDSLSRKAADFFGKDNIKCFFDPSFMGDELMSVPVIKDEVLFKQYSETCSVVLTWNNVRNIACSVKVMCRLNVEFSLLGEAARDIIEREAEEYDRKNKRENFAYDRNRKRFFDVDRVSQAGSVNHYFWQDLWAAKHIFENKPEVHYDIGSRVDGFIANLLSFGQKVNLIDVRPLDVQIPGVNFTWANATELKEIEDGTITSLSALCSLEHFGLGRYGDQIDPEACFKCFDAIQNKVAPGGDIYIAVPVGREGVEFNAHRIFYAETIVKEFSKCKLIEFSIDRGTHIEYDASLHVLDDANDYEFGLFYFQR